MRRLVALAALLILMSFTHRALASSCIASSLADYIALPAAGCSIGQLSFSQFAVDAFPGPGATQIAPSAVTLAPRAGGFSIESPGALLADAGDLLGLHFTFHVSAPALTGGTVSLADRSVTPDGALTAILDAGAAGNAIAFDVATDAAPSASFISASSSFFDVFVELGIDGGVTGAASAGPQLASIQFAAVPEPSIVLFSLIALGVGLGFVYLQRARAPA